ncbi:MAG: hypothetical protein ACTSRI_13805 [Promethearchaeota archaeon]
MSEEKSSSDPKFRVLTELKTSTGKEYQDAMLGRVEYFKQKNLEKSQFNSTIQNTVVKALSTILDVKVKVDKALGEENLNKVQDVIENILMFGL